MKIKNNTDAPQLVINWKHVFLVSLHLIAFSLSIFSESFTVEMSAKALP